MSVPDAADRLILATFDSVGYAPDNDRRETTTGERLAFSAGLQEGRRVPDAAGERERFEAHYRQRWDKHEDFARDETAYLRPAVELGYRMYCAALQAQPDALAALVKTRDWLASPNLEQWPYMENGPFYTDRADILEMLSAAIKRGS